VSVPGLVEGGLLLVQERLVDWLPRPKKIRKEISEPSDLRRQSVDEGRRGGDSHLIGGI
jgi:hypothetical protein